MFGICSFAEVTEDFSSVRSTPVSYLDGPLDHREETSWEANSEYVKILTILYVVDLKFLYCASKSPALEQ